jgi:chlorobactene glucosyltransferase
MPSVTVIVPARNEEANIGPCIESLLAAAAGTDAGIVIANDASTDRTAEIAAGFAGRNVELVNVPPLPAGWVGKNHALAFVSRDCTSEWLLFTDADTRHEAGTVAIVLGRAAGFDLYSLSPEQETVTWWERAVVRRVYRELDGLYRFEDINRMDHPAAAANGQYLLMRRSVYEQLGGHSAVAGEYLEDVAIARAAKTAGFRIYFGSGQGIVRTRMYSQFRAMWEGWTRNLFLLYRRDKRRVVRTAVLAILDVTSWPGGLLFGVLLANSLLHHRKGHTVAWKGREYASWSS